MRRAPTRPDPRQPRVRRAVWPQAVTLLGALYLVQALVLAFQFYGTR